VGRQTGERRTAVSRERILERLRLGGASEGAASLPEVGQGWTASTDLFEEFKRALEAAGGVARVASEETLATVLAECCASVHAGPDEIHCEVAGAGLPDHAMADGARDPAAWADLRLAVLPGELGVAENGAVWIREDRVSDRALYFLPEHVVIVVRGGRLVADLHQAYAELDLGTRGFAAFISGPSKTADIEQALVIGAHGPRSLTVVLVRD
jgi:L-lactate dehydrogenase complex protein LldG